MKKRISITSPAKINLHLEVLEKRQDGYHEIKSIFIMVSLADHIVVYKNQNNFSTSVKSVAGVPQDDNLISKAISVFQAYAGKSEGIIVDVEKKIPIGAGLGGGSSNAASTLIALNELYDTHIEQAELLKMAEALGSDVPFFCGRPAAAVAGRGERIYPISSRNEFQIALIYPDIKISTAKAFLWLDAGLSASVHPSMSLSLLKQSYEELAPEKWKFFNSFSSIIQKKFPEIRHVINHFMECGALHSDVSGSGSAVFGIFLDRQKAENALERSDFKKSWLVHPLEKSPSAVLQ